MFNRQPHVAFRREPATNFYFKFILSWPSILWKSFLSFSRQYVEIGRIVFVYRANIGPSTIANSLWIKSSYMSPLQRRTFRFYLMPIFPNSFKPHLALFIHYL